MQKYKVYIYGMGNEYNRLSSYLSLYKNKLEILGVITTKEPMISWLDGHPCTSVEKINTDELDYVIIAVVNWKEIANILESHGIDENRIIRSSAFYYPCFDLDDYLKLKHSKISILSNFCLGGQIYNELGLRALTPTKNMFCLGKDYLEFLENYQYYLALEMQEYEENTYVDGTLGREAFYPKGILGDKVIWYFNHDAFATDAIKKWNDKRKLVNCDNIAAIMILQNDDEISRFLALKIDKKIGIYYKEVSGKSNIIYCPRWNDKSEQFHWDGNWPSAANKYLSNFRGYVSPINWIKFLNGDLDYKRF